MMLERVQEALIYVQIPSKNLKKYEISQNTR